MNSENSGGSERAVGIEITASELIGVCLSADGTVIGNERVEIIDGNESVAEVANFAGRLKEEFGPVERLGIAVPGLIRRETSRVAFSARIPSHEGIDIATKVESATGLKTVLENDANAAAFAEYKLGA